MRARFRVRPRARAIVHGPWTTDPRYLGPALAAMAVAIVLLVMADRWWSRLVSAEPGSTLARVEPVARCALAAVVLVLTLRGLAAALRAREGRRMYTWHTGRQHGHPPRLRLRR